ncbi:MAG: DNA damage-inducible protein D [Bacilli bacterium]|nr:DNA damage-inducible protein D [Bacilli bacterium]
MNEISNYSEDVFERIKHIDENGREYWEARELQDVLAYKEWRKFKSAIDKAKKACIISDSGVEDHFVDIDKMVDIGSKTKRKLRDFKLSRYACYLIVQNGDSRKQVVAYGQTYFAVQTRRQELYDELSEDEKRLIRRKQVSSGNYSLNRTAVKSGVKNLAEFHNAGYKGLYGGETADDIYKRKGLRYREDILDNMGSEELAANLFRITQTDAKLKRDKVDNEYKANSIHYDIAKDIRQFIIDHGGTMPEDLPNPDKSIKEIEKNKE